MSEDEARALAEQRGWTLALTDNAWHVLDGGLPIATGWTIAAAVRAAVERLTT